METPRLVVGAASRAPPPAPRSQRRRILRPCGGAHCSPSARAAPPVLLTRCSSYSSSREGNGDSHDILYINKQRLIAMEEMKKLHDENNLLLEEIQGLETEMQGIPLEAAQSSSFSELLLRIDTMVISGMISMTEASDLREKLVTNRSIIQSTFCDIHHKPNTELLSELQLFLRKPIDTSSGVGLVIIEPSQLSYFSRDMLRGYPDDFERFSYFSRASLDYIVKSGKRPDIIHIHNWETAIVAPLFWEIFAHQGLGNTRILLTCQDLNSECLEEPNKLEMCGLDPRKLHRPDRLQDTNKTHLVNILKGGIVYSNKVVLMSSTHSKDALIQGSRHELQSTLAAHREKILVASYGLDGELWDPFKDIYLPRRYSANDIEGKSICRQALRRRLRFNGDSSIIVGCICDDNSDVHSLKEAVHVALHRNTQVIIMETLGSVVNSILQALKGEIKGDKIAFVEAYDEALAHLIYAGSDIILCSSFQDPSLQIAVCETSLLFSCFFQ
ncbi:starch synthase5 [Zea mays]|uniref:starch synthase n=1 Tax=Zea mays TaxID=4577 RepID=A0A1D6QBN9_MAIZE|nr:starch synthase5 [Zea mays]